MQPQACLSKLWKGPPKCLTTHLTRLEPQRDAMCSTIFHNINTVGPWRDWVFYRCAQGRQLPWLCASSQHLIGNGARSCTEGQGAGQALTGTRCVCVSGERQRAHTAGVPVGEVKQKRNPSVGRAAIVGSEVTQQYTANALLQWNFTGYNVLKRQHIPMRKLSVEI